MRMIFGRSLRSLNSSREDAGRPSACVVGRRDDNSRWKVQNVHGGSSVCHSRWMFSVRPATSVRAPSTFPRSSATDPFRSVMVVANVSSVAWSGCFAHTRSRSLLMYLSHPVATQIPTTASAIQGAAWTQAGRFASCCRRHSCCRRSSSIFSRSTSSRRRVNISVVAGSVAAAVAGILPAVTVAVFEAGLFDAERNFNQRIAYDVSGRHRSVLRGTGARTAGLPSSRAGSRILTQTC